MRTLIDTNILLYTVNENSPQHDLAKTYLTNLLENGEPWCLSWVNIYEFLRVVTHPVYFPKPLNFTSAWEIIKKFLEHPSLEILMETNRHTQTLEKVVAEVGSARGNIFHDCHIAALMLEHDVKNIATADTEFRKFRFLKVIDPTK